MKYEVIAEKFDRFEEPIVRINQFNSGSDALAILKVAIYHGSVGKIDKDGSKLTLDDALEILNDALANDDVDCVYRITNLTTRKYFSMKRSQTKI